MARKLSDYIPILAAEGIDYVAAADAAGVGSQYQLVTVSGGTQAVTLAKQMANVSYAVLVTEETGAVTVAESSKTVTGFDLIGGGAGEIANVLVIGQLNGQKG
jgi:hypothetical protein